MGCKGVAFFLRRAAARTTTSAVWLGEEYWREGVWHIQAVEVGEFSMIGDGAHGEGLQAAPPFPHLRHGLFAPPPIILAFFLIFFANPQSRNPHPEQSLRWTVGGLGTCLQVHEHSFAHPRY